MIVLVGERSFLPKNCPLPYAVDPRPDPQGRHREGCWSIERAVTLGAFETPSSRRMLDALGLREDIGLNLLPPGPQGSWSFVQAGRYAQSLWGWLGSSDQARGRAMEMLVVLAGRRVQHVMDCQEMEFGVIQGAFGVHVLAIPHPSPLNRLWNDAKRVSDMTQLVRQVVMPRFAEPTEPVEPTDSRKKLKSEG